MLFIDVDDMVRSFAVAYFPYITQATERCANITTRIGDGRLVLAHEPKDSLDVLVLDAFTSDAIPAHLATAEALSEYALRVAPHGLIMVHVSSRFLDLAPVVATTAASAGMRSMRIKDAGSRRLLRAASEWVFLVRNPALLELTRRRLEQGDGPYEVPLEFGATWSDDRYSLLDALRW